mgnify:CR=1 FL=1
MVRLNSDRTLRKNQDRHAPTAADGPGLSPCAQAQPDDCGFSRVGGAHPGAPGRGGEVPAQAGFDLSQSSDGLKFLEIILDFCSLVFVG